MKQSNIHTQKLKFTNYFINNFLGYSMGWIVKKNSNETQIIVNIHILISGNKLRCISGQNELWN